MKQLRFSSFRQRLNAAFLAVSLVPLLLCSALLLQIFRLRMTADQQQNAQQQLDGACYAVDTMHEGLASAAAALQKSRTVLRALSGGQADSAAVYSVLFDATEPVRRFARFDLYDADGTLRYSTQTAPEEQMLSTSWGVLQEAVQEEPGVIVYCASGNPLELSEPVLRAAARLTMDGQTAGYLVAAMYESHFRTLLDAMAGAQNALLVMDRFWHGIYCSQQAQVLTLSNALRGQLLAGRALTGLSDNFLYTARQSGTTGLYLVLQQPQVFTRGTLRLLYTVSALCALGGVVTWMAYLLCGELGLGPYGANFIAAAVAAVYAEGMARARKYPVTSYQVISAVPLLPGAGIYYTMSLGLNGSTQLALQRGFATAGIAGSIAAAILLVSSVVRLFTAQRKK